MDIKELESEHACLGSCLLDKNCFILTMESLLPNDFYDNNNKEIFTIMLKMFKKDLAIDLVTLTSECGKTDKLINLGGVTYLTNLINSVPTIQNIEHYINLIKKASAKRKQKQLLSEVVVGNKTIEQAMTELEKLGDSQIKEETFQKILETTLTDTLKGTEHQFSIDALNKYLGGFDKGELITIGGFTSQGKCFKKGTEIVMFSGRLKNIEDIEIGDLVMGTNSSPHKVMSTHNGYDDMWEIQQHHGINYTVNSEHILALRKSDYAERYRFYPNYDKFINIPIKEYINKNQMFKKHFQGYRVGVDFIEMDVLIEPYFLGVWLGDGDVGRTAITTVDKEISDYLYQYADVLDLAISKDVYKNSEACLYRFKKKKCNHDKNILTKYLEQYNLIQNKHIPDDYLYNTSEIRMQILAGLIDTDGYTNSNGYVIIQKNNHLSNQIYYLASSLGLRCSIKKTTRNIKKINFKGEYNKIEIWGDTYKIPVKINRKKVRKPTVRHPYTTGFHIEYKGAKEYFGLTLDGDGLFLLKDFTVVHNSDLAIQLAIDFCIKQKRVLFLSTEMLAQEIGRRLLGNLGNVRVMDLRKGLISPTERTLLEDISKKIGKSWNFNIKKIYEIDDVGKYVRKYEPEILVLDYIQNLSGEDYKMATRNIKYLQSITMNKEISTICVSQLNRGEKEIREPRLSDLRDTGRIEEVSNMVLFLYWKERLQLKNNSRVGGEPPEEVELLISKNRDGTIGRTKLHFYPEFARFEDPLGREYQQYMDWQEK